MNCRVPTSPRRNGEFVSSSTSHACATDCIHVPMRDTSCAAQNRRKSRCRNARSPPGSRDSEELTASVYDCFRAIAFASSFFVIVERPLTPSLRARAYSSSREWP